VRPEDGRGETRGGRYRAGSAGAVVQLLRWGEGRRGGSEGESALSNWTERLRWGVTSRAAMAGRVDEARGDG
jgi:hypothetical protein